MSTLQVANIHLESTANNRIQYTGSNTFSLSAGGSTVLTANSTGINSTETLTANVVSLETLTFASGNSITNYTVSNTAPSGGSDGDVWIVIP